MPRLITALGQAPGIASYQLGASEEWTLRGVFFSVVSPANTLDGPVFLDVRAPPGQLIHFQLIDYITNPSTYSLSSDSEPMLLDRSGPAVTWPQMSQGDGSYVTERLTPITLTPGCTLSLYITNSASAPPADPQTNIDTSALITEPVLWVDDVAGDGLDTLSVDAGPYMLIAGPGA